jgi:hypothetical protein
MARIAADAEQSACANCETPALCRLQNIRAGFRKPVSTFPDHALGDGFAIKRTVHVTARQIQTQD